MSSAPPKHLYTLHFDIVHGCQLRCVGCPNSTLEPKIQRISVEDFALCLGNIDVERIHTLRLFNYGEPLLHKQLSSIVAQIPRQRWKASVVEISTNAQWVDWHDFEEALKQEVITRLCVSCDGDGSPEQYEELRPPSKWEKLIEFLDRAAYLRDKHAGGIDKLEEGIQTVGPGQDDRTYPDNHGLPGIGGEGPDVGIILAETPVCDLARDKRHLTPANHRCQREHRDQRHQRKPRGKCSRRCDDIRRVAMHGYERRLLCAEAKVKAGSAKFVTL